MRARAHTTGLSCPGKPRRGYVDTIHCRHMPSLYFYLMNCSNDQRLNVFRLLNDVSEAPEDTPNALGAEPDVGGRRRLSIARVAAKGAGGYLGARPQHGEDDTLAAAQRAQGFLKRCPSYVARQASATDLEEKKTHLEETKTALETVPEVTVLTVPAAAGAGVSSGDRGGGDSDERETGRSPAKVRPDLGGGGGGGGGGGRRRGGDSDER